MVTMHDVLDAQWMLDNHRDGEKNKLGQIVQSLGLILFHCRELYEKDCEASGRLTDIT